MHDILIAFSFIAMLLIPCFATVQDEGVPEDAS